jgi:hypothetical protein
MSDPVPIVARSTRPFYIAFSVILVPVAIVGVAMPIIHQLPTSRWIGFPTALFCVLGLTFYYLHRLRLALSDRRLVYRAMWRETEIPIDEIQAIEVLRPYGLGQVWIVTRMRHHHAVPVVVKIGTFDPRIVEELARQLHVKAPGIRFSGVRM